MNTMTFARRVALSHALAITATLLGGPTARAQETIRIAVTAGPHAQIAEVARQVAARDGLTLKIVEFQDYIQPNAALDAGDVEANSYQHLPFLESQIKARGYKISSIGYTVSFPMGFYSKRVKSLADLPKGAKVGIQNDPSNSGRALQLLQKYGVLRLKPGAGIGATVADVIENPKNLQIVQVEAAQLPRSLDDLDAAAINTNYAVQTGLVPTRDAIAIEDSKNPYANLLAVRSADKSRPWVPKLVKAFQSPEVKKLVESSFSGSALPAF